MSGTLISYGEQTDTIFKLFGTDENAITKSLSWALMKCPKFAEKFVESVFGKIKTANNYVVYYQHFSCENGITDIEITDNENYHIIIEAKKGWNLPQKEQLEKYSEKKDFRNENTQHKKIVSLSECGTEYAENYYEEIFFGKKVNGIDIIHISWKTIFQLAKDARNISGNSEKNILDEMCSYLEGVISMQNYLSNKVYCVSLNREKVCDDCSLSWMDIVRKYKKYTCPQGHGWPVEPPNYIAFRYDGRLQSIHHIESYVITNNIHKQIPEYPDIDLEYPNFVLSLDDGFYPTKIIKSEKNMRATRVWAMYDLLITCDTIKEAVEKTKLREQQSVY